VTEGSEAASTATPDLPDDPIERVVALIVARGELAPQSLERGRKAAIEGDVRLDRALNQLGLVADEALLEAWSAVAGRPIARALPPEPVAVEGLAPAFLKHARCLPLALGEGRLTLAVEDPLDGFTPAAVAAKTGLAVETRLARAADLEAALKALEDEAPTPEAAEGALRDDLDRLRDLASDAPVVRFVNATIDRAVELGASDIHLSATVNGSRLRFRIDGTLREMEPPRASLHAAVISRIKIMAGLDIAERRLPQDGRIRVGSRGRELDLRVATVAHAHGEGVVLRLLDRSAVPLDFASLGLSPHVVAALKTALAAPYGLVVVTGPTGSGKTTTLYAALTGLRGPERNIVTVEDPIEYHLDGINQIQVARRIGLDFAHALRSVLRQDPDVIMVGEIRDRETAVVATQAALTGHFVLATVHTNTAAGALPRLVDMGVEPFLLASTVRGAMAQRLVRRLCPHCRQPSTSAATILASFAGGGPATAWEAVGCGACDGTGYKGRVAIAEFLPMSDKIRAKLLAGADEAGVAEIGRAEGLVEMTADGIAKVRDGTTTIAEVIRVAGAS
jgi:general secretion pathway protein E